MSNTTRENLKKYRKLYYRKSKKKRIGCFDRVVSAFLVWQLIIIQLVFNFNLSRATAADIGAETISKAGLMEDKAAEEDGDLNNKTKESDMGVITEGEKVQNSKKITEKDHEEEKNSDAPEAAVEPEEPEAKKTEKPKNAEKIEKNDISQINEKDPEPLWKTCGLSDFFGKVDDKKECDKCKEKDSCEKIEICLKARIEIENDANIDNDFDTTADTGENKVDLALPVSAKEDTNNLTDSAGADGSQGRSDRDRGQNREDNQSIAVDVEDLPENTSAEITTGDAVAVADVVNVVNTNIVGENGVETVENIYGDYKGDINLLDTFDSLLEKAKNTSGGDSAVPDAVEISIKNEADIDNEIATIAGTGQNEIDNGDKNSDSAVTTGDAIAVANVVNIVNTNIVGNNFLFAVVNVFGNWIGDLIVPGEGLLDVPASDQSDDSLMVDVRNEENIENNLETVADSGGNEIEAEGGQATIKTGGAIADSVVINQIGTTIIANNWFFLAVNNMGNWMGSVLNWNKQANAYDTVFSFDFDEGENLEGGDSDGWLTKIFIKNEAQIKNSLETFAHTGGNEIEAEGGAADIKTGNAYAFSKVYNLVNSNFIGNNWMFAVVNIFGTWQGNVNFVQPESAASTDSEEENVPPPEKPVAMQAQQEGKESLVEKKINPSLALSRSVSGKKINVGEIAKHTIVLENTGDSTISDIVISDKVADGDRVVGNYEWRVEKLDPGKKAVVKYKLLFNAVASPGDYRNKASSSGYDENGGEIRSNEATMKIAVRAEAEAAADQKFYQYTYYTYYHYRKPTVPVESGFEKVSAAEEFAAPTEGKVLGRSLDHWNRSEPENFNPGWILLPVALLLVMRRRAKGSSLKGKIK